MPILFYAADIRIDDDFNNLDHWEVINQTPMTEYEIRSGRLYLRCRSSGDRNITLENTYKTFDGDFDVEIEWENNYLANSDCAGWTFSMYVVGYGSVGLSRFYGGGSRIRYGNPSNYSDLSSGAPDGKFRITRENEHLRGYHDIGSGWVSTYDNFGDAAGEAKVRVSCWNGCAHRPEVSCYFDNLIEN